MRRKDKEIIDHEIIQEILNGSRICRLGLVDNGEAYIVPVNYAYKEGNIYIHSAPMGRKMDILMRNNRVTFEIEYHDEIIRKETPCEWSAKYRSIIGSGIISIETDNAVKKKGLEIIMKKYGGSDNLKFSEASVSGMVLIVLKVLDITGKQSGDW